MKSKEEPWPNFRFNIQELAGAVGDYGTLFPIVLGVAVVTEMNLAHILLFFSIWYIFTGLYYKKPVPVEPMKAIGAIVIAGQFTQAEIAATGVVLGIFFLIIGFLGGMKFIEDKIPQSIIRGVQLGLALILVETSLNFLKTDYLISVISIGIILLFFAAKQFKKIPDVSSLLVLVLGFGIGVAISGFPSIQMIQAPSISIPAFRDFVTGTYLLAIPQIPLTVTNSILATSLLMGDLFKKKLDPDELSKTVGFMNLLSTPFGGFPMCHGSGGLAAQYRYGARTGGSNILSGLILLLIASVFASAAFIDILPQAIFGALLVFVAVELGKHSFKTKSYLITGIVAVLSLLVNITAGFFVGLGTYYLLRRLNKDK
ncbi:MAG: putative sulfate/molybdate transporter [Candidatus Thermoplasmatota archaeon]|nr:putative sulfate/molybdate transporter [Candidatus Thermoplasmatota archaeon]MBS3790427.1 putative sulfate/molybdate transporter [Candidatus Thermoplasmatota archaeon]